MAGKYKAQVIIEAMDKATRPIKGIAKQIDKLRAPWRSMKDSYANLGGAIASITTKLGIGIGALSGMVTGAIFKVTKLGDDIAKQADRLGVPIAKYHELRYAAQRSGLEVSQFDRAFQMFTRNVGDAAEGEGVAVSAFQKLRIHLRDSKGEIKSNAVLFEEVAEKTSKLTNRTEQLAVLYDLFSRQGAYVMNMVADGSKGLEEYRKRLEAVGGTMKEKVARDSEAFVDLMLDVRMAVGQVVWDLVGLYLPEINQAMDNFVLLAGKHKDRIISIAKMVFDRVFAFTKGMAEGFKDVGKTVYKWVIKPLGLMGDESATAEEKTKRLSDAGATLAKVLAGLAIVKVVAMIASLSTAIVGATTATWTFTVALLANPITWWVAGIGAVVGGLVLLGKWIWKTRDTWIAFMEKVRYAVLGVLDWFGGLGKKLWDIGVSAVNWLWEGLKSKWVAVMDWFKNAWNDIKSFFGFGEEESVAVKVARQAPQLGQGYAMPAMGGAVLAGAGGGQFNARMRIEFENAPPGMRIRETEADKGMDVDTGHTLGL